MVCVHPHVSVCVSGHTCTQVSTRGCECALHTRRPSSPSRCASRDCSDAPQGLLLCPWCFPPACPLAPRGGGLGRPSAPGSPPLPGFLSRFRVCWWRGRRGPGGGAVWPSPAGLRGVWPRPRRPAAPRPRCGLQAPAQREAPGGTGLPVPRVWAEGQRPSRRPACDAPTPHSPQGVSGAAAGGPPGLRVHEGRGRHWAPPAWPGPAAAPAAARPARFPLWKTRSPCLQSGGGPESPVCSVEKAGPRPRRSGRGRPVCFLSFPPGPRATKVVSF